MIEGPHHDRRGQPHLSKVRLAGHRSRGTKEIRGRAHASGDRRPQHHPRVLHPAWHRHGEVQDQAETRVGDDNWIMAYVHIAHDCVVGNQVILCSATLAGHVHVGDQVIIRGLTGVHQYSGSAPMHGRLREPHVSQDDAALRDGGRQPAGRARHEHRGLPRGFSANAWPPSSRPIACCIAKGLTLEAALSAMGGCRRIPRPRATCPLLRDFVAASRHLLSRADGAGHGHPPRVAMVAGGTSGDLLAGLLLDGLRARWPGVASMGIGGPRMQERSFDAWWHSERLAVHGYSIELVRRLWGHPADPQGSTALRSGCGRTDRTCSSAWCARLPTWAWSDLRAAGVRPCTSSVRHFGPGVPTVSRSAPPPTTCSASSRFRPNCSRHGIAATTVGHRWPASFPWRPTGWPRVRNWA